MVEKTRLKYGVTMIELLVAVTVAAIAITGIIYMFKQSKGSMTSASNKLTVLHQGRMLLEYLKRDLRSIYVVSGDSSTTPKITDNSIKFVRSYGSDGESQGVENVEYTFSSGTITRNCDGKKIIFGKEMAKVDFFEIKMETIKEGYKESTFFSLNIKLVGRDNPDREHFTINDKIFPLGLRSVYHKGFMD